jgi:hypothetical protein
VRGVRRDPLEASRSVQIVKRSPVDWQVADDPKAKGLVAPSKVNHCSVPFPEVRDRKTEDNRYSGVTIEYAETDHDVVTNLPAAGSGFQSRVKPMRTLTWRLAQCSPRSGFAQRPSHSSLEWDCAPDVCCGQMGRWNGSYSKSPDPALISSCSTQIRRPTY